MPGWERQELAETVVRYTVPLYDGHATGGDVAEAIHFAIEDKRARGLIHGGFAAVDEVRVIPHDEEIRVEYRCAGPLPPAITDGGEPRG